MTRLASAFGETTSLRTKTFELGGHTFKVRIPLSKELDALHERVKKIDQAEFKKRFDKMNPVEVVEYVRQLNNEIFNKMIKSGA